MSRRLIDWLLEVDLFELKAALQQHQEPAESLNVLETLDEVADSEQEATIPNTIALHQAAKGRHGLVVFVVVGLVVAAAVALLLLPDAVLGPLAEPLAGVRAPVQALIGNVSPKPEPPAPPSPTAQPLAATTTLTAPAAASAPTATTPATAVTIAATTATTLPVTTPVATVGDGLSRPMRVTDTTPPPAPTQTALPLPAQAAPAPAPAPAPAAPPPPLETWYVVAGPLAQAVVPQQFAVYDNATGTLETKREKIRGREVVSIQPVARDKANALAEALQAQGYTVTFVGDGDSVQLKIGPFAERSEADKAAIALVSQGVPPQTREAETTVERAYLRLGPFTDKTAAAAAGRQVQESLGVRVGLETAKPTP